MVMGLLRFRKAVLLPVKSVRRMVFAADIYTEGGGGVARYIYVGVQRAVCGFSLLSLREGMNAKVGGAMTASLMGAVLSVCG